MHLEFFGWSDELLGLRIDRSVYIDGFSLMYRCLKVKVVLPPLFLPRRDV